MEWRTIPSFPLYEASGDGQVRRRFPGKRQHVVSPLKHFTESNDYVSVTFWVDGRTRKAWLHRCVCEAFHGSAPSPLHEAAHGDGIRSNNSSGNLRWATKLENYADTIAHGTSKRGEGNHSAKLTEAQVSALRQEIIELPTSSGGCRIKKGALAPLAKKYGISVGTARAIGRGDLWRHVE